MTTRQPRHLIYVNYRDQHYVGSRAQPEGHGSLWHEEGEVLANVVADTPGNWLEIGAERGSSTRYIILGLRLSRVVYSVDIRHQLDETIPGRVRIDADSRRLMPSGVVVGAFIDGAHDYWSVVNDIGVALRWGASTLVFHDTTPTPGPGIEVRQAVLDHLLPEMWEIEDIQTKCGMIVARRKS